MAMTTNASAINNLTLVFRSGAIAGGIGAVAYTVFAESVTLATKGAGAFFFPFRQIGAVVLGPQALEASYNLLLATAAGTVVHFAIAAVFGIVLALIAARLIALNTASLIALGLAAGLAFYALDVFVVFPAAFPWFLANSRIVQSVGHALFGAVTGGWLAWRRRV